MLVLHIFGGVNDRFSIEGICRFCLQIKLSMPGLLKHHFCGGLITVNIYLGNFEGISLTIVHCFTKKNSGYLKGGENPEPWR